LFVSKAEPLRTGSIREEDKKSFGKYRNLLFGVGEMSVRRLQQGMVVGAVLIFILLAGEIHWPSGHKKIEKESLDPLKRLKKML
jgi:hypothetical protein